MNRKSLLRHRTGAPRSDRRPRRPSPDRGEVGIGATRFDSRGMDPSRTAPAPARPTGTPAGSDQASEGPDRSGLVLIALISVAAVANLNLAVANVALPDIGKA